MSDFYSRDGHSRLRVEPEAAAEGGPMAAGHETSHDAAPHYSVGDELRMRREAMGKSIADIVDAVRIQGRYLEALEDGRLEDLPGTVYALGFVRTYAEFLGLDGTEVVARYKEETEGLKSQDYVMPEPLEEGKVPTAAILLVAVVLAAAAYGAWYFYSQQPGGRVAQEVPDVPERLSAVTEMPAPPDVPPASAPQEPVQAVPPPGATAATAPVAAVESFAPSPAAEVAPAAPSTPPPVEPVAEPPAETVVVPAPVAPAADVADAAAVTPQEAPEAVQPPPEAPAGEPSPAQESADEPSPAQETAQIQPAPTPESQSPADVVAAVPPVPATEEEPLEPTIYGLDNVGARIVITADEDAWLEVTDSDDARLFSRVLRKGDSYRAPNREGAKFVTGNAGGLRITVDGEPVPTLGPPGQVRRDVKLDPDLLKAGQAWP